MQQEIGGGLRRYADRVELIDGTPGVGARRDPQDQYLDLIRSAAQSFRNGDFSEHRQAVLNAATLAGNSARALGLDRLELGICASEITSLIGHIALGLLDTTQMVVVTSNIANPHYLDYWREYFPVHVVSDVIERDLSQRMWPIVESIQYLAGSDGPLHLYEAANLIEHSWEQEQLPALLSLRDEDRSQGLRWLAARGFAESDWFVTLHVRWDERGPAYGRNADIADYQQAIALILDAGGWVIRIGSPPMPPMQRHERVIDLASEPATPPWLDVFALAACRFMIGTESGPSSVPQTFGVPVLMTNITALSIIPYTSKTLTMPKLARVTHSGEILGIDEILNLGVGWVEGFMPERMRYHGERVQWRDNTPEEITSGTLELMRGEFQRTVRQAEFELLATSHGSIGISRPAESFLAAHPL